MRISVELIPRDTHTLQTELARVKQHLSLANTINIPDLLRFDMRSYDACYYVKPYGKQAIPHLRAIDYDLSKPLPFASALERANVQEVLVVTGDPPQDDAHLTYQTSVLNFIHKLRRELPHLRVYASVDPYRQNFTQELLYAKQKIEAGASGLFTQPFFDVRLMQVYMELLAGMTVFWGITNVTSVRSQHYWQKRNKAIFPADFSPTLGWNRRFAKEAFALCEARQENIYFMPIRTDIVSYLGEVLCKPKTVAVQAVPVLHMA